MASPGVLALSTRNRSLAQPKTTSSAASNPATGIASEPGSRGFAASRSTTGAAGTGASAEGCVVVLSGTVVEGVDPQLTDVLTVALPAICSARWRASPMRVVVIG